MTIEVIDSPRPDLVARHATELFAEGVRAAILYINPLSLSSPKTVRREHIDVLRKAGIDVGFVCEGWGGSNDFAHNDINARTGTNHGKTCSDYLNQLGAPDGTAIYPTVDNDTSPTQLKTLCIPYFQSFRSVLDPRFALGAYGCGALLFALEQEEWSKGVELLNFPWQTNAMGWSRSREYVATNRWAILQQRETKLLGIDIDPDVLNPKYSNYGFWKSGAAAAQKSSESEAPPKVSKPVDPPDAAPAEPQEQTDTGQVRPQPGRNEGTES